MREEYRYCHALEQGAGSTSQHRLSQTTMAICAHDNQVASGIGRCVQNRLANAYARGRPFDFLWQRKPVLQAIVGQVFTVLRSTALGLSLWIDYEDEQFF